MINLIKKIISYFEQGKWSLSFCLFTFFFSVSLRNFIECFTDKEQIVFSGMLHLYVAYAVLALSLAIIFSLGTKTPIVKTIRVILPSFIILLLAPTLDFLISGGHGFDMNYMQPSIHKKILLRYFTFFGPIEPMAVTPGIRIEVALVLIGCLLYFFSKTNNWLKSIFLSFVVYTTFFVYGLMPFFVTWLSKTTGVILWATDNNIAKILLVWIFILALIVIWLSDSPFKKVLKEICIYRNIHYQLMYVLGVVVALNLTPGFVLKNNNLFSFIYLPISIFFSGLYVMIINNINDIEIDRISNKNRALASENISLNKYSAYQWPLLLTSLGYASLISFKALFLILVSIGNYYMYSLPPLRVKRIPFFSKLVISTNSLIMALAGFLIIQGSIFNFPVQLIIFFILIFTFPVNFIDLKDYEGDKAANIKTLPVLLGLKRSKLLIGAFFFLTYLLSAIFLLKNLYLTPALILIGIIQFYLVNKMNYKEKYVFQVYLLSIFAAILYIYLFKVLL